MVTMCHTPLAPECLFAAKMLLGVREVFVMWGLKFLRYQNVLIV